jgi:hypothetical protein
MPKHRFGTLGIVSVKKKYKALDYARLRTDQQLQQKVGSAIDRALKELNDPTDYILVEECVSKVCQVMIPRKQRKKQDRDWFDRRRDQIVLEFKMRRATCRRWRATGREADRLAYVTAKRKAQQVMRLACNHFWEEKLDKLDEADVYKNGKGYYEAIWLQLY